MNFTEATVADNILSAQIVHEGTIIGLVEVRVSLLGGTVVKVITDVSWFEDLAPRRMGFNPLGKVKNWIGKKSV